MAVPIPRFREIEVPESCAGMRVDRFLSKRFAERSRSWIVEGIRAGQVCGADDQPMRPSTRLKGGEQLRLTLPGIAPSTPPPPFPEILHEDDRVVVVHKPAGLLAHPAGTDFAWALITLAKARWPDHRVDLVHRLDRDTSGVIVLSKDLDSNRYLKKAVHDLQVHKVYEAIVKGEVPWESRSFRGSIGSLGGVIRIQMAVVQDGLSAHTDVSVLRRQPGLTHVRCVLHTGRTHQIRVHLATAGFPLLGDRMYGVPAQVFLHTLEHGPDGWVREQAGAPHHALHAASVCFPHPDGGELTVNCPLPAHLERWWAHPEVLPHDPLETP